MNGPQQNLGTLLNQVDELKQEVNRLKLELNRFRQIIDAFPDHIYTKDIDHKFTCANRATANYLGHDSPSQILGLADTDLQANKKLAKVYFEDEVNLFTGDETKIERVEEFIGTNGESRWLSTTKVKIFDEQGALIGLAGINRDITEEHLSLLNVKARVSGLDWLRECLLEISQITDESRLASVTLEKSMSFVGARRAGVFKYDADTRRVSMMATESGVVQSQELSSSDGDKEFDTLLNAISSKKGYEIIEEPSDSSLFACLGMSLEQSSSRVNKALAVTLSIGTRIIGGLYLIVDERGPITPEDGRLISLFADHVALAFENVRAIRAVTQERDLGEKIKDYLRQISNLMVLGNTNDILLKVAQLAQSTLNSMSVSLYEYDSEIDLVKFPPVLVNVKDPVKATMVSKVPRESIVYRAASFSEITYFNSVSSAEIFARSRFAEEEKVKSCIVIPLRANSDVMGVMFVNFDRENTASFVDQSLVELFSNQAAIAIQNARLLTKTESHNISLTKALYDQRVGQASAIREIAQTMTARSGKQVLDHLLASSKSLIPKAILSEVRFLDAKHDLILEAKWLRVHVTIPRVIKQGKGITGWVAANGEPCIIPDVINEPRYFAGNPLTKSEIAVPVFEHLYQQDRKKNVIGTLAFESSELNGFDDADKQLAEAIASLISFTIERLSIASEIKKDRRLLEKLYESSNSLIAFDNSETWDQESLYQWLRLTTTIMSKATSAMWITIVIADKDHIVKRIVHNGPATLDSEEELIRATGVTSNVLKEGRPRYFPRLRESSEAINPLLPKHGVRSCVCHPLKLGDEQAALWIMYKKEQTFSESEKGALGLFLHQIEISYENRRMYLHQQKWFEQATHQIISPLNGLQGYASNCLRRFDGWYVGKDIHFMGWTRDEIEKWKNELESMVMSSHYAARLARNLAWPVYKKHNRYHTMRVAKNVADVAIKSARIFQGIARARGLGQVTVDVQSIKLLDRKVKVNEQLLRQALENILDNAIKYSDDGEDVIVHGELTGNRAYISVTNAGLRLEESECSKIFEYEFRTEAARLRNASGTGIGLPVAKDIALLHGGDIIAMPSVSDNDGITWRTTFSIILPTTV